MFALGCGQPRKPAAPVEIRYLPAPKEKPCIREKRPLDPTPPKCLASKSTIATASCSPDEEDEYLAALLDHRMRLVKWADRWQYLCGTERP